jgi:3-deoxy-D-manno-octulosonic-acid transferase
MPWLLNVAYLLVLVLLSPWLLYNALTTGKYRRGLWCKFTGSSFAPRPSLLVPRPLAWFHGVSVGEIHLLRQVVAAFHRRHPDWDCAISTTTDTGFDEARNRFPDLPVFFFPLDFSWAVRRTLRRVRPSLIVLAESELWPNFLLAAKKQGVPVAVVNGRMSPRSQRRHRRLGPVSRWLFNQVDLLAMQTDDYAEAVRSLDVAPAKVHVTGSVKYDGVATDRRNPRAEELRRLFDVRTDDLIWVAGSTQAPEEEIVLGIFQRLQRVHPNLRLFLVPRQKDRFDEVARLLERSGLPFARRSVLHASRSSLILVDTIGELGALWGLADVAFVGGSLDGRRGGQNMIEPAAYGAAVTFGPHVWNFKDTAARLVAEKAALQVADAAALEETVGPLLADASKRQELGRAAQQFVLRQQGATERTMELLDKLLQAKTSRSQAA